MKAIFWGGILPLQNLILVTAFDSSNFCRLAYSFETHSILYYHQTNAAGSMFSQPTWHSIIPWLVFSQNVNTTFVCVWGPIANTLSLLQWDHFTSICQVTLGDSHIKEHAMGPSSSQSCYGWLASDGHSEISSWRLYALSIGDRACNPSTITFCVLYKQHVCIQQHAVTIR